MAISNVSSGLRPGICTSTTRPQSPYNGFVIYETDTKQTLVWQGSAWVMLTDADQPPGLQLIKTQTVGNAESTVNVTSCFSSEFDNYRITFSDITASSNGGVILLTLLSGTNAPSTSNWNGNTFYIATASTVGLSNANISNAEYTEAMSTSTSSSNHGVLDIQGPFLAKHTRVQFMSADNNYVRWHSSIHTLQTSYDGARFVTSGGTITGGTIRVYGYRK